jgi:hypothetical protein
VILSTSRLCGLCIASQATESGLGMVERILQTRRARIHPGGECDAIVLELSGPKELSGLCIRDGLDSAGNPFLRPSPFLQRALAIWKRCDLPSTRGEYKKRIDVGRPRPERRATTGTLASIKQARRAGVEVAPAPMEEERVYIYIYIYK